MNLAEPKVVRQAENALNAMPTNNFEGFVFTKGEIKGCDRCHGCLNERKVAMQISGFPQLPPFAEKLLNRVLEPDDSEEDRLQKLM